MGKEVKISETYSFTEEELTQLSKAFRAHIVDYNDNGNDGRYKFPKHWMKFTIFAPPRGNCLYKGFECACGFKFYLRKGEI